MRYTMLVCVFGLLSQFSCAGETNETSKAVAAPTEVFEVTVDSLLPQDVDIVPDEFSRAASFGRLKTKVAAGEDLFIHLFVPLCDNENQGIVPVAKSLGDGLDLRSNLYWGAKYGVANYYPRLAGWKTVATIENPSPNVLQRRIFLTKNMTGNRVYLIADAYRGDRMKACLDDFFKAVAGRSSARIEAGDHQVGLYGFADLIAFSGHNGLMDTEPDPIGTSDGIAREVVVIGCVSQPFFDRPLRKAGGFPLLTTTNLMAPEAYVSEAVFRAWSNLATGPELRRAAGIAYDKYQKCGVRGATKLFATGWDEER